MMRTKFTLTIVLLTVLGSCLLADAVIAAPPVSLESLLQEMLDVESIARWPQAEFTCRQASSYDRAKVAPDKPGWFANNDYTQYIRVEEHEGRKEHVMMDAAGPGAIVRFWLTGWQKVGVLRIYLDGQTAPALTFQAFDLLQGDLKVGTLLAHAHPGYTPNQGGNNLYFPIPYARHCKVTWEEKGEGQRYYQINYRTYAAGTAVQTFALPQVEAARGLIDRANRELEAPVPFAGGKVASLKKEIAAGAESSLDLPGGQGAVRALELRLEFGDPRELERALRSVIVKLTFDDEMTAWVPATDFFGTGVGINVLRSWYRNVSADGTMRCRWVMPYAKSARVTLENLGTQPVKATLAVTTSPWTWDDRSMHFYAAWHHESGLKTQPVRDWNYIRISGRGVYAGDSLALFNPIATWYGEGDEKIWVDGESFPSHVGTGTEDYYGYSYAPQGIIQTPFSNHVRTDKYMTQGWNVMSRTRQLDGIPFGKTLQFDIELMSWKPTTLTYAATTYWYAFPGATSNIPPQPKEAALPIPTLAEPMATLTYKSKTTASFVHVSLDAIKDQMLPISSSDTSNSQLDFWPHKGTTEWLQFEWDKKHPASGVKIYWFDDSGGGQCKLPKSWKALYRDDGGSWQEVKNSTPYSVEIDKLNEVKFEAVTTDAIKLEIELQKDWSAGVQEVIIE